MSVFSDLIHAAECGRKYRINLKDKTLKIDNHEINLENRNDLIDVCDIPMLNLTEQTDDSWSIVEQLYTKYKKSAPSARYYGNKPYFHADDVDVLTDDELAFNEPRGVMQAKLEGFVLLAGLNGWLTWQNGNHWFWQGNDRQLVILKEWIV